ncbi:MAG: hypothetical protein GC189_01105 [Alphaproteobacteria bacterium]|nr:hypothetical protein [Alphaproteobacteria bacterium]
MGKFEKISAALERLPAARREEIAEIIETLFHGDLHPETALTDPQIEDLRARLADPGDFASEEDVAAFFRRFSA